MHLTGSLELATPLPANMPFTSITFDVLSYSFNDGRNTTTELNSVSIISLSTDGSGNILRWNLAANRNEGASGEGAQTHFFGIQRKIVQIFRRRIRAGGRIFRMPQAVEPDSY